MVRVWRVLVGRSEISGRHRDGVDEDHLGGFWRLLVVEFPRWGVRVVLHDGGRVIVLLKSGGRFFSSMSPCAFNSPDTVRFVSFGWSEGRCVFRGGAIVSVCARGQHLAVRREVRRCAVRGQSTFTRIRSVTARYGGEDWILWGVFEVGSGRCCSSVVAYCGRTRGRYNNIIRYLALPCQ